MRGDHSFSPNHLSLETHMRFCFFSPTSVLMSIALAACGGDDPAGPSSSNLAGTYTGAVFYTLESPTQTLEAEADGTYRFILTQVSGSSYEASWQVGGAVGGTSSVSIDAAGIMTFADGDEADFEEAILSLVGEGCDAVNASTIVGGSVSGNAATFTASVSGLVCEMGDGSTEATVLGVRFVGQK